MTTKNILILSDSLCLSRDRPRQTTYEQTWISMLSQVNRKVLQSSVGGTTLCELFKQSGHLKAFQLDDVIIQAGVVDTAPRALSFYENIVYNYWWITNKSQVQILQKHGSWIRDKCNISYAISESFEKNRHSTIAELDQARRIYCIGTSPVTENYEQKTPSIDKRAKEYNQLLCKIFGDKYIDMSQIPLNDMMSDNVHPNPNGSHVIYERVTHSFYNEY